MTIYLPIDKYKIIYVGGRQRFISIHPSIYLEMGNPFVGGGTTS